MAMAKADPEREERRRQQKEIADSLKESGALDEIFGLPLGSWRVGFTRLVPLGC